MSRIIFDASIMKIISLFESVTHANVKDCIKSDDSYLFIVDPGEMGKAIGKGGRHIKQLERSLKKRVRVAEFNDDPLVFLEHLVAPAKVSNSQMQDGVITLTAADTQSRGVIIGRGGAHLRFLEKVMQRYFEVTEIKVG